MTDLETKLAEAREPLTDNFIREDVELVREAFDAAANIAREVVAEKDAEAANWEAEARKLHDLCDEKDAEIARLEARANRLGESYKLMAEDNAKLYERLREPRKVTDAQREAMVETLLNNNVENEKWARKMVEQCCRVLESKVDNATKTI
jgi:chromosome segregation ATPase